MFNGRMSLGAQLQTKFPEKAVEMATRGQFMEATKMFEQSGKLPGQQVKHTEELANAFYRRALFHQSNQKENHAIADLETAQKFPKVSQSLRSLIQQRLTIIRNPPISGVKKLDEAIEQRFGKPSSNVDLKKTFFIRFGLSPTTQLREVDGIDEISSIGVYRWSGDTNRNEQWSKLIRQLKEGDSELPAFFGRILAEHVRETPKCRAWIQEIDFVVPIPAAENRKAERGMDIVGKVADHLSSRLQIPIRKDFLKRHDQSMRSRFISKTALKLQYSFRQKKSGDIKGRTVLLIDDVMNRGYTASVCAVLLRDFGCSKIVLLVLALSESTLQSSRNMEAGHGQF